MPASSEGLPSAAFPMEPAMERITRAEPVVRTKATIVASWVSLAITSLVVIRAQPNRVYYCYQSCSCCV